MLSNRFKKIIIETLNKCRSIYYLISFFRYNPVTNTRIFSYRYRNHSGDRNTFFAPTICQINAAKRYISKKNFLLSVPPYLKLLETLSCFYQDSQTVVWDIGANIGYTSIAASLEIPNSRIYSFEPSPINQLFFNTNTQEFPNINLFPFAFSSTNNLFHIGAPAYSLSRSLDASKDTGLFSLSNDKSQLIRSHSCLAINLHHFLDLYKDRVPDIIKIDTEGMELEILKEIFSFVNSNKELIVFFEFNRFYTSFEDVVNYFQPYKEKGFRLFLPSRFFNTNSTTDFIICHQNSNKISSFLSLDYTCYE